MVTILRVALKLQGPGITTHESHGRAEMLAEELGYLPLELAQP
jgi:hypothetical protein